MGTGASKKPKTDQKLKKKLEDLDTYTIVTPSWSVFCEALEQHYNKPFGELNEKDQQLDYACNLLRLDQIHERYRRKLWDYVATRDLDGIWTTFQGAYKKCQKTNPFTKTAHLKPNVRYPSREQGFDVVDAFLALNMKDSPMAYFLALTYVLGCGSGSGEQFTEKLREIPNALTFLNKIVSSEKTESLGLTDQINFILLNINLHGRTNVYTEKKKLCEAKKDKKNDNLLRHVTIAMAMTNKEMDEEGNFADESIIIDAIQSVLQTQNGNKGQVVAEEKSRVEKKRDVQSKEVQKEKDNNLEDMGQEIEDTSDDESQPDEKSSFVTSQGIGSAPLKTSQENRKISKDKTQQNGKAFEVQYEHKEYHFQAWELVAALAQLSLSESYTLKILNSHGGVIVSLLRKILQQRIDDKSAEKVIVRREHYSVALCLANMALHETGVDGIRNYHEYLEQETGKEDMQRYEDYVNKRKSTTGNTTSRGTGRVGNGTDQKRTPSRKTKDGGMGAHLSFEALWEHATKGIEEDKFTVHNMKHVISRIAPKVDSERKEFTRTGGGPDIFISYSWKQKDTVKRISSYLKKQGFSVWIDDDKMEGNILKAMSRGIDGAVVFLMCYSKDYEESENCYGEAIYAKDHKKKIIPLKITAFEPMGGWLKFYKGDLLHYDVHSGANKMLKKVVEKLREHLKNAGAVQETKNNQNEIDFLETWSNDQVVQHFKDKYGGMGSNVSNSTENWKGNNYQSSGTSSENSLQFWQPERRLPRRIALPSPGPTTKYLTGQSKSPYYERPARPKDFSSKPEHGIANGNAYGNGSVLEGNWSRCLCCHVRFRESDLNPLQQGKKCVVCHKGVMLTEDQKKGRMSYNNDSALMKTTRASNGNAQNVQVNLNMKKLRSDMTASGEGYGLAQLNGQMLKTLLQIRENTDVKYFNEFLSETMGATGVDIVRLNAFLDANSG